MPLSSSFLVIHSTTSPFSAWIMVVKLCLRVASMTSRSSPSLSLRASYVMYSLQDETPLSKSFGSSASKRSGSGAAYQKGEFENFTSDDKMKTIITVTVSGRFSVIFVDYINKGAFLLLSLLFC